MMCTCARQSCSTKFSWPSSQVSFSLSVHIFSEENEEDPAKIKYSALGKNKVRNRVT